LDLRRRELLMDGRHIELSQREFVLLAHRLHRKGQVWTRRELLADVWGVGFDPGTARAAERYASSERLPTL
jgi:two-component system OmpR family response regulator